VLSDKENTYLYGLDRIGQQGPDGWAYHLPDALGSVRPMADPNAGATFAQAYEPYGNVLGVAGEARTPYGFAGEWMDRTGLAHLRARYYAPYFGAFVQPDPWPGSAMTPDTLLPYLYAGANPIVYRDPSERCYGPLQFLRQAEGVSWLDWRPRSADRRPTRIAASITASWTWAPSTTRSAGRTQ
jgi:RHS repeat-associated protein